MIKLNTRKTHKNLGLTTGILSWIGLLSVFWNLKQHWHMDNNWATHREIELINPNQTLVNLTKLLLAVNHCYIKLFSIKREGAVVSVARDPIRKIHPSHKPANAVTQCVPSCLVHIGYGFSCTSKYCSKPTFTRAKHLWGRPYPV